MVSDIKDHEDCDEDDGSNEDHADDEERTVSQVIVSQGRPVGEQIYFNKCSCSHYDIISTNIIQNHRKVTIQLWH